MPGRHALLSAALLMASTACSAAASKSPPASSSPSPSATGNTPAPGTSEHEAAAPGSTEPAPATTLALTDNHVFLLGDSITESVGPRYSGTVCTSLEPLGWNVIVDAHMGRNTTQATKELHDHLDSVGQVLVVLIGHNDPIDPAAYRTKIGALLSLVPTVPRILLLTNYQFETGRDRMNAVLGDVAAGDPRIQLVDWNAVVSSTAHAIGGDGLHLSSIGEVTLADTLATALGRAPDPTDPTPRTCTSVGSTSDAGTSGSRDSLGTGHAGSGSGSGHHSGTTTDVPGTSAPPDGSSPPGTSGPPSGSQPPPDSRPHGGTTNPPHTTDAPHPPPSQAAASAAPAATAAPAP
jgi:lysophospholipase L1-like esterase